MQHEAMGGAWDAMTGMWIAGAMMSIVPVVLGTALVVVIVRQIRAQAAPPEGHGHPPDESSSP